MRIWASQPCAVCCVVPQVGTSVAVDVTASGELHQWNQKYGEVRTAHSRFTSSLDWRRCSLGSEYSWARQSVRVGDCADSLVCCACGHEGGEPQDDNTQLLFVRSEQRRWWRRRKACWNACIVETRAHFC